ncbi:Multidrug resistance protein MexA [Thalassocella blandensis]|nr:Multidrug resistance protein MexA [Thalassocella blandensis]
MVDRKQRFLPFFILIPGIALVFAIATLKPSPTPDTSKLEQEAKPRVAVAHISPETVKLNTHSQGTVSPRREIDLVAQVAGQIIEVDSNFVAGGFFQQGSTLVQIDPRDYESALINAKAQVAEAQQRLAEEKGRARQAKREWRDLGNDDANALFLRKPQLAAAQAALASAQAHEQQAQLHLQRTRIMVPFTGRVAETLVDLGQYVSPGSKIARVYDAAVAEVRLPLNNRQAALVDLPIISPQHLDEAPKVSLRGNIAGKQFEWQGVITRTEASIDTRSRMYYAIAEVENPFNYGEERHPAPLMMGLFVEAEIEGQQLDNVLVLPRSALFKRNKIYSLDADNKAVLQTVDVLQTSEEHAWVRANLEANTPLVINKLSLLTPGTEVEPVESEKTTPDAAPVAHQGE